MRSTPELSRILRSWLREDRHEDAERVLLLVLDQLDTTPQRHASWLARRFRIMNSTRVRFSIAAAALVAAALIGLSFLPQGIGDPPSPTPAASAAPLSGLTVLPPGRYSTGEPFPVNIAFEIPAEGWSHWVWESGQNASAQRAVCKGGDDCRVAVSFNIITDLPADSCGGRGRMGVGPSVEDLATAIVDRPLWIIEEDGAEAVIDGYPATLVAIRAPDPSQLADCRWVLENYHAGLFGRSNLPGEGSRMYILEVDGQRLVIELVDYPDTSDEERLELEQILDSIDIQPAGGSGSVGTRGIAG